ncbi:MAG: hypothetical protein ACRD0L_03780, partial [Acidimicrobiales bacterium]
MARITRADWIALAVLVGLPALGFGLAAATGHLVLPGDELTQSFPLRVLAGHDLALGQLPLWDPYLWSGTPLLGGFNAGALYPFTVLFAVLPAAAAWTIGMAAVYAVASTGLFAFLRAEGRRPPAAFLGAVSFAFAGAMLGQIPHLGLIEGLSWLPWILLAQRGLSRARGGGVAGWVAALGLLGGLVVLTGEPRAVSSVAVVAIVHGLALLWRHPRRWAVIVGGQLAGAVLAGMLGAPQLLPGLAFLGLSQRAQASYAFFSAGSLPWPTFGLLAVPYLFGGYGNFGAASYLGPYNLPEVTSYVGLLPLAAALALAASPRRWGPGRLLGVGGRRAPGRLGRWEPGRLGRRDEGAGAPVGAWWALVVIGLLLSVAGRTPVGPLLHHIPLYGSQRLQNRNLVEADLGLAVLLSIWADQVLDPARVAWSRAARWAAGAPLAALGLSCLLFAAWGLGAGPGLGLPPAWRAGADAGAPLVAVSGALALAAAGLAVRLMSGRRPSTPAGRPSTRAWPRGRWRGLLRAGWRGGWRARCLVALAVLDLGMLVANAGWSSPPSTVLSPVNAPAAALGRLLGPNGRFAVWAPTSQAEGLVRPTADLIGTPDLNILHGHASVQGYGSIVSGTYNQVTGTHTPGVLAPTVLSPSMVRELDLQVLLVPPKVLASPAAGRLRAALRPPLWQPAGRVGGLAAFRSTIAPRAFRVETLRPRPAPSPSVSQASVSQASVSQASGSQASGSQASVSQASGSQASVSQASVSQASVSQASVSQASVSRAPAGAGSSASSETVTVRTASPALVVRSVAFVPGWEVEIRPAAGPVRPAEPAPRVEPVRRHGLVQAVAIPAGTWLMTWRYRPPGLAAGLALGLCGSAALLALAGVGGTAAWRRRRAGPGRSAWR